MSSTPYESATLLIRLYELRREDKMREARQWYVSQFHPSSVEDVMQALAGPHSAGFRMVTRSWDMASSFVLNGAIAENNFNKFSMARIAEDPLTINIQFFPTAHWLVGMGHDRGTSVQAAIANAVFEITGKRFRDLPLRQHDLSWG